MKTRGNAALTIGAAAAVILFAVIVLLVYRMRPTPGTAVLVIGWMSILAAGYFLVRSVGSLSEGGETPEALQNDRREELLREKKLLLKAIKESEFDRDTGKLDHGEAGAAIARYRGRAVEILRLLDEDPSGSYEKAIEAELARRLAAEAPAAPAPVCPACGTANDDDAAFCKKCGARIGAAS